MQEYWSGLPLPPPGDLPDPEIEPQSSTAPELTGRSLPLSQLGSPLELNVYVCVCVCMLSPI